MISVFLLAWLPLTSLGMNTNAHSNVSVGAHSGEVQLPIARDWSFSLMDQIIEHQWMTNTVNMTVNLRVQETGLATRSEYFTSLLDQIIDFLTDYPNEDDYWEIVNRHLTQTMLQKHPELRSLTILLEILPRPRIPYTCISTVTVTDQNQITETWQFRSPHIPVHHPARGWINVSVKYTYKPDITAQEYPDFVPIQYQISDSLMRSPEPSNSWEMLNRQLAESILAKHPTLKDVTLQLEALPTLDLPYAYVTSISMPQAQPD
ncbi:MAG TPA: hypothetical protein V6C78_35255 [Crinalium sp.]